MESKLIEKINQNYKEILNILKSFLKENFNNAKENNKNYDSFDNIILNKKKNEIGKYIEDYSNKKNSFFETMKNTKQKISDLIKDILTYKRKIIENTNESLYLVKHPQDCLFLLKIDEYNNNINNYINLIETQIYGYKYDKLESLFFILCNMKINSK